MTRTRQTWSVAYVRADDPGTIMSNQTFRSFWEVTCESNMDLLEQILAASAVRSVYQPIVELVSGSVVAYEALARGPQNSPLEQPDQLFAAARASGRLRDLDWACRQAAVAGALEAGFAPPLALFVNIEPATIGSPIPHHLREFFLNAARNLRIIVEITERALTARPADLLGTVRRVRELGWGIALDDVGADAGSLALMPLLHPDVIKLDLRLIHHRPDTEIAEVVNAVLAQAELTGASVLAEGIETEQHRQTALAMGASLGQGWLFGRPAVLPANPTASGNAIPLIGAQTMGLATTPFELVQAMRPLRRGPKSLLFALSKHLEKQAFSLSEPSVILATFQKAEHFTSRMARRYTKLGAKAAFVGVLGVGISESPATNVRGATMANDDPLGGEWNINVVGAHFAGGLIAKDLGDSGPDEERRFEFVVTYDRKLVIQAAQCLMSKIAPVP